MRYRKKPVVIEAMQFTGGNIEALHALIGPTISWGPGEDGYVLYIRTPEGTMKARTGDWIIKGVKGELYPCKPDIFEATYEPEQPPTPETRSE